MLQLKLIDYASPVTKLIIAVITTTVSLFIGYIISRRVDSHNISIALLLTLTIQIIFLAYEFRLLRNKVTDLFKFIDAGSLIGTRSALMRLRAVPRAAENLRTIAVSDQSKGEVWLGVLEQANSLIATCYLNPDDWWLTQDGEQSLSIQRKRIRDKVLSVHRIFILKKDDLKNKKYLKHIYQQADSGAEIRWVEEGDEHPKVATLLRDIKMKFDSLDISVFDVNKEKLLYVIQHAPNYSIGSGIYKDEGEREAELYINNLFKVGKKAAELREFIEG